MTTSASYQSHLIETDIELQCLYNQAFSGTLENYSVVIPNVTKHEANRTFIRDVFDFYALGEVTSVQYLETNIGNHETRIHFRPYETQQMNKLLELHSDNMYYTLKLNKYNPENHENSKQESENLKNRIVKELSHTIMPDLDKNITDVFWMNPKDFKNDYNSMHGAGFSIAPIFTQSAWFRYHNKDKKIRNLYFSAAGSHPGAGIPGVLSSAKVVENIIKAELKK